MHDEWAGLAEPFVRGAYATVKGRVRTYVVDEQLRRHLPPPPAAVLDVGGGAGHQALPLARAGYDVVLLDASAAMLAQATERLGGEPAEVRRRVRLVEGDGANAAALVGGRRFAAVCCHGVLMYLDDPAPLVAALCERVAPGGIVSILALNAHAMAVRPALEGRWADALAGFEARREPGVLGVTTRADTVDELSGVLASHGVDVEAWYGVWLFTDWLELAGKPVPAGAFRGAAEAELAASSRDPYRRLSRLFHLVGRR